MVEVFPSPKLQEKLEILPELMVELLLNTVESPKQVLEFEKEIVGNGWIATIKSAVSGQPSALVA